MNRDEFEKEYVKRHMGYDPRGEESKVKSVERLREGEGYSDDHMDLCWKVQQIKNSSVGYAIIRETNRLVW